MSKSYIAAAFLGIAIIAGVVFSSYRDRNMSTEEILSKVFEKVSAEKFLRQTIEGKFVFKGENIASDDVPPGTYPTATFSVDQVGTSEYWVSSSGDAKGKGNMKLSLLNFTPEPTSVEADIIVLTQTLLYIKLNELSGIPMDLSSVTGKWWKFDMEALIKNFGGEEADTILESIKGSQLSKEEIEQLKAVGMKYKNAARIEKLADSTLEGAPAYHFSVVLDKAQLPSILKEVMVIVYGDSIPAEGIDMMELAEGLEALDIGTIEIFVNKKDYLPAQAKFSVGITDTEDKEIGTLDISTTMFASEPVEIQAPPESTDILYLMGALMTGMAPQGDNPFDMEL
jgi:hypothetical protein